MIYFHFLFKLRKAVALICRYADGDSQRYFHKNMLQTYAADLNKRSPDGAFSHKIQCILFPLHHQLHFLVFPYLTANEYYRLLKFLNDSLVHMYLYICNDTFVQVLNIGTYKMFETKF